MMDNRNISIATQGHFTIGGKTIQHSGIFDDTKFVSWSTQNEKGQSYRCDHATIDYQIPENSESLPLVYIHGYAGSGLCWQMTPDGREGFATLMLRRGWSNYIVDLPGRGRAGRTSAVTTIRPMADEMFWFEIWRIGIWPDYHKGVQFPIGDDSLSHFFREMTPDLSDHKQDIPVLNSLAEKIGEHILITHSSGGYPGWMTAIENGKTKAIAALEPGGFVFPEGEVPDHIPGLTGGISGFCVSADQFTKLTKIPLIIYFGDNIPTEPSNKLGYENWRVRLQMAHNFVETINRHGGNATLIELPKEGVFGNTHFLMQDMNNDIIASLLDKWLKTIK